MKATAVKPKGAETPIEEYEFRFHEGFVLIERLAKIYHSLLAVILEQVQNALDKGATSIVIGVNSKARTSVVRDNGYGVTPEEFQRALTSVGKTIKADDKLGQFGLGMVAGLGVAKEMSLTSTPRSNPRAYRTWTFDREKIKERTRIGTIPCVLRPDLHYGPKADGLLWRTEFRCAGITGDKKISELSYETLYAEVVSRYGVVMRRNKVTVTLVITEENGKRTSWQFKAPDYAGEPLPEATLKSPEAGETAVRLFFARADKKYRSKGRITVGVKGNDFRIPFAAFVASLPEKFRAEMKGAAEALQSGYFEGEIVNSRVTLDANRRGFELNEQCAAFCLALAEWFATIGVKHYEEMREARESARRQEFGRRALGVVRKLMEMPAGSFIKDVIGGFSKGTISRGHTQKKSEAFTSFGVLRDAHPELGAESAEEGKKPNGKRREIPEYEKPADTPLTVAGPKGPRRAIVRDNSLGLTLMHDLMPENLLWQLDVGIGVLRVNIRHPLWVRCSDKGDAALMRFQVNLIVKAFMVQAAPEELRELLARNADREMEVAAFLVTEADAIAGLTLMGVRGKRESRLGSRDKKPPKAPASVEIK